MTKKIDYGISQKFWENRADINDPIKAITLTSDALAHYRDETEKRHVFRIIRLTRDMRILDLGCGTGRWAIDFAKTGANVVAVDFSPKLLEIAKKIADEKNLNNISFFESGAQDFVHGRYDIIFIGGLLCYLNDDDVAKTFKNCKSMLLPQGRVVIRDSISLRKRMIKQGDYPVIYRPPQELISIAEKNDFKVTYQEDAHPVVIPQLLFENVVPMRVRDTVIIQKIYKCSLSLQSMIDFSLIKFFKLKEINHKIAKKHCDSRIQQFFILTPRIP